MVNIATARQLIGKKCSVRWLDRKGAVAEALSKVHDVAFERLYGGYLILDCDDVSLDKITSLYLVAEDGSFVPVAEEFAAAA